MNTRDDETWHRLLRWTASSTASERLAAHVLHAEGYTGIDPSHPLGGKDGGKDAVCEKDGRKWIMACYFPRDQKAFCKIEEKFLADLEGVASNSADGIVFVTNQELRLAERRNFTEKGQPALVDIVHLERLAHILDRPSMHGIRAQFLHIALPGEQQHNDALKNILGNQTGGDTYAYAMLYDFSLEEDLARQLVIIRKGDFALHDLRIRVTEPPEVQEIWKRNWGEISSPAEYDFVRWRLRPEVYLRFFFHARNGQWHQDLVLRRHDASACWLAATRVTDTSGKPRFEFADTAFKPTFGEVSWRE